LAIERFLLLLLLPDHGIVFRMMSSEQKLEAISSTDLQHASFTRSTCNPAMHTCKTEANVNFGA
jgi:hypothetical protein